MGNEPSGESPYEFVRRKMREEKASVSSERKELIDGLMAQKRVPKTVRLRPESLGTRRRPKKPRAANGGPAAGETDASAELASHGSDMSPAATASPPVELTPNGAEVIEVPELPAPMPAAAGGVASVPAAHAEDAVLIRQGAAIIRTLPEHLKAILHLRHQGLDNNAIRKRMGTHHSQVAFWFADIYDALGIKHLPNKQKGPRAELMYLEYIQGGGSVPALPPVKSRESEPATGENQRIERLEEELRSIRVRLEQALQELAALKS